MGLDEADGQGGGHQLGSQRRDDPSGQGGAADGGAVGAGAVVAIAEAEIVLADHGD